MVTKKAKKKKMRKWLVFLGILLLLLVWWHFFFAPLEPRRTAEQKELLQDKITVLILGSDSAESENSGSRTDTIMLACLDLKEKKVHLMSIPRDSRVSIPGRKNKTRINAAFGYGGADLTKQTVEGILGIPVDYYMFTTFEGFAKVVDIIGGVEIDVEKRMKYHTYNSDIDLEPGLQVLDGKNALDYVRFRHDALADLNRVKRQQKFLLALANEMKKPENWAKLPQILAQMDDIIQTDFSKGQIVKIGTTFLGIRAEDVTMETIPGVPQTINGVSYFIINENKLPEALERFLGNVPEDDGEQEEKGK